MKRMFYLGLVALTIITSGCAVGAGFQVGANNHCVGSAFHSSVKRGESNFASATQIGKHKYRLDVDSESNFRKE